MQTENRLLDDLAQVLAGAVGGVAGLRQEVEARLKDQLRRLLGDMELVGREEFEAVKAMAAKARTEQERLEKRLAALESRRKPPPAGPA